MRKIDGRKLNLCFVGNMLGRNAGYITSQGQILADLFAAENYQVLSVSSKINKLARAIDIIQLIVRNSKQIDLLILEVYSNRYMILADLASSLARYYGIPLIAVLHGGNLPNFIKRHRRWVTSILKRAKVIAAPSQYLAESMKPFGFNVRVIPNVIELAKYSFRLRRNVAPRLIWMRSFHPAYNPRLAIEAFCVLRETHPEATLVMAGRDKGLEPEIKMLARQLNVADAVRFPGFLDERAKIKEFSQADIYLNTNSIDNMPVAVIEACAFGLPVVATDVGGISYLLTDHQTGLLVPDGDLAAVVTALKNLLREPALAERLSKNGRRLAENSSWNSVRHSWMELFDEVT